jgi:hypothetical protein
MKYAQGRLIQLFGETAKITVYRNLLIAIALPEPNLKYFSRSLALSAFSTAPTAHSVVPELRRNLCPVIVSS